MLTQDRLDTTKLIGRCLGTLAGRSLLASNGYVSETPIIAAEWETPLGEAMATLASRPGASRGAVLAIRKGETLFWMGMAPSEQQEREASEPVHSASTVGLLYQSIKASGERARPIRITNVPSLTSARVLLPVA